MSGTDLAMRESQLAQRSAATDIEMSRAVQEVQAAMIIAKRFPREHAEVEAKVVRACSNAKIAASARYEYVRGGTKVEGPSIRLAEVIARAWGNNEFGIRELDQADGVSTVEAFAWDKETNTTCRRIFQAKHWRDTKSGGYAVTGQRDVYELVANLGARRMRACILEMVDPDIVELAEKTCEETLRKSAGKRPLGERIGAMVDAFRGIGVDQQHIEDRLGHRIEATTENELITLGKVYTAIRDQMTSVEQQFPPGGKAPADATDDDAGSPDEFDSTSGDALADEAKAERDKAMIRDRLRQTGDAGVELSMAYGISGPAELDTLKQETREALLAGLEELMLAQTQAAKNEAAKGGKGKAKGGDSK